MQEAKSRLSHHLTQNCAANGLELHKVAFTDELCAIDDTFLHKVVQCAELVRKRGELFIFVVWEINLHRPGLW